MDNLEKIEIYKKGIDSPFVDEEFKALMRSKIAEMEAGGEKRRNAKFSVGDYVSYGGGDVYKEKWQGKIISVVDLDTEFAYRVDAYGKTQDGLMFDGAKHNEKYEAQLQKSTKDSFDKLAKSFAKEKGIINREQDKAEPNIYIKSIHDEIIIAFKNGKRATYFIDTNKDGTKRIVRHTGDVQMTIGVDSTKNVDKWLKDNFDEVEILGEERGAISEIAKGSPNIPIVKQEKLKFEQPKATSSDIQEAIELLQDLPETEENKEAIELLKDLL